MPSFLLSDGFMPSRGSGSDSELLEVPRMDVGSVSSSSGSLEAQVLLQKKQSDQQAQIAAQLIESAVSPQGAPGKGQLVNTVA